MRKSIGMLSIRRLLRGLAPLLLGGAGLLQGGLITYTFSGNGTGALGATRFTAVDFVVTLTTDTANVVYQNSLSSVGAIGLPAVIDIAGVGVETFTGTTVLYDFNNEAGFAEGDAGLFTAPGNIISIDDSAFVGYDLISNLTVSGPNVYLSSFSNAGTDGGALTFNRMSNVTFQAVATAPEPGSMFLLLGAFGIAVPLLTRKVR
jgi:hypothetical protein